MLPKCVTGIRRRREPMRTNMHEISDSLYDWAFRHCPLLLEDKPAFRALCSQVFRLMLHEAAMQEFFAKEGRISAAAQARWEERERLRRMLEHGKN
jgi:hypothetical protein